MVTEKIIYRIFGIPVWSVEKRVNIDELYTTIATRFAADMKEAFNGKSVQ